VRQQYGYAAKGGKKPQVNLMYAIALKDDGIAPVFYKRYPGSIRDVSAFRNMANEMGLASALVIADRGFTKKSECERLEGEGLFYLMPLKRNNSEYPREPLRMPGRTGFQGRFKYNNRIIWYFEELPTDDSKHKCCVYLDESLCHAETVSRTTKKIGEESPAELLKAAEKQLEFGTFVLGTNLLETDPERVYLHKIIFGM
jgi:transposase